MSDQRQSDPSPTDVSESFYERGLTDGLPIVPPTEERIDEMLRGTDLPGEHVLGRLGNDHNPLTVEQLASNAVMAGCVPPYMPVLEAGVRAMADPASNSIQFSVSTGSWAYQWIVNGPVREALEIRSSTGATGPYFHANRTISRALGLAYKNTARIQPAEKDMAVMGNPFKYSLLVGENEEASPWEPYHVSRGFDAEDSTITLGGPNSIIQWWPQENTAEHVLRGMIRNTPPAMVGGTQQGGDFDQTILHLISPYNADELGKADLSRREVQEYVAENAYIREEDFQKGVLWDGALEKHHGKVDAMQVPQFDGPEYVQVATVGGPGRWNAIVGPSIGGPVTEAIELPDGWDDLVSEYAFEREWYEESPY